MLLKCTKNLVLDSQVIIMKHDVIKILGSDVIKDSRWDKEVAWYDCEVEVSGMCEGMEFIMDIFQLAEHFEYLEIRSKHTTWKDF